MAGLLWSVALTRATMHQKTCTMSPRHVLGQGQQTCVVRMSRCATTMATVWIAGHTFPAIAPVTTWMTSVWSVSPLSIHKSAPTLDKSVYTKQISTLILLPILVNINNFKWVIQTTETASAQWLSHSWPTCYLWSWVHVPNQADLENWIPLPSRPSQEKKGAWHTDKQHNQSTAYLSIQICGKQHSQCT